MEKCFPPHYHGYCLNHLKMNFRDSLKGFGKKVRNCLVRKLSVCAHAPTPEMYLEILHELLTEEKSHAFRFFFNLNASNCATAYFHGTRYGDMTSNAVKSYNKWILDERHLPIISMVDRIRKKIMIFFSVRTWWKSWTSRICPGIDNKLYHRLKEGKTWITTVSTNTDFEVQYDTTVRVDLAWRLCYCMRW